MGKNADIKGVGGWLMLLVIGTVLGPLASYGRISGDILSSERTYPNLLTNVLWQSYKTDIYFVLAIGSVLSITAGIKLCRSHTLKSLFFARVSLWIVGPIASVTTSLLIPLYVFGPKIIENGMGEAIGGSTITAGIWTLYLFKSIRVKNTYVN